MWGADPCRPSGATLRACRASGSASTPSNTSSNRYRPECYHPHASRHHRQLSLTRLPDISASGQRRASGSDSPIKGISQGNERGACSTRTGSRCSERPSTGTAVPPNRTPGANPGHVAVPALTWVRPGDWTGPALCFPRSSALTARPGQHAVSPVSNSFLRGGCTLGSAALNKQQLIGPSATSGERHSELMEFSSPADVAD